LLPSGTVGGVHQRLAVVFKAASQTVLHSGEHHGCHTRVERVSVAAGDPAHRSGEFIARYAVVGHGPTFLQHATQSPFDLAGIGGPSPKAIRIAAHR
jgi:hypothetical protein